MPTITPKELFVDACRRLAGKGLGLWQPAKAHTHAKVVEEYAGDCEIIGWLAMGHTTTAYEPDIRKALSAASTWPWVRIICGKAQPEPVDMVLLCNDGASSRVAEWLPCAKYAVVAGDAAGGSLESDITMAGHLVIDSKQVNGKTVFLTQHTDLALTAPSPDATLVTASA